MFERNKIDNIEHTGVPVEIVTADGDAHGGRLMIAIGRTLADVLNGTGGFVEFEPWGGERQFIAKASIRSLKPVNVPKSDSLKGRVAMFDGFDPYMQLGVKPGSTYDEVKSAWHRLSKIYHPDRYAAAELPGEVVDYLSAMARRVNAAFAALEAPLVSQRRAVQHRAEPIYTSRPRS